MIKRPVPSKPAPSRAAYTAPRLGSHQSQPACILQSANTGGTWVRTPRGVFGRCRLAGEGAPRTVLFQRARVRRISQRFSGAACHSRVLPLLYLSGASPPSTLLEHITVFHRIDSPCAVRACIRLDGAATSLIHPSA